MYPCKRLACVIRSVLSLVYKGTCIFFRCPWTCLHVRPRRAPCTYDMSLRNVISTKGLLASAQVIRAAAFSVSGADFSFFLQIHCEFASRIFSENCISVSCNFSINFVLIFGIFYKFQVALLTKQRLYYKMQIQGNLQMLFKIK